MRWGACIVGISGLAVGCAQAVPLGSTQPVPPQRQAEVPTSSSVERSTRFETIRQSRRSLYARNLKAEDPNLLLQVREIARAQERETRATALRNLVHELKRIESVEWLEEKRRSSIEAGHVPGSETLEEQLEQRQCELRYRLYACLHELGQKTVVPRLLAEAENEALPLERRQSAGKLLVSFDEDLKQEQLERLSQVLVSFLPSGEFVPEPGSDAPGAPMLRERMRNCYQQALDRDSNVGGEVSLFLIVNRRGRTETVLGAQLEGNLPNSTLQCMKDAALQARFSPPKESRAIFIRVPVSFIKM